MTSRVAVHLVVRNAEPWLATVLDALQAQTYSAVDVIVWDNSSDDATPDIIARYGRYKTVRNNENIGVWAAQERMLNNATADYILALTDVVLDPSYVAWCVRALDADQRVGAVQGKLLQKSDPTRIDSLGFHLQPSRRVTILGHGDLDDGRWSRTMPVFGVEGAAPMFRRLALEDCRIDGHVVDPDFRVGPLGYGDDFDLAWRMTLLGWRQIMEPNAIGWHDRATTTDVGHGVWDHVRRRTMRANIPILTRQLDWANVRFAIVKNDHILNIVRDMPVIAIRELMVLGYCILFEPRTLLGLVRFIRLMPVMVRRRRLAMERARLNSNHMRQWIQ